MKKLSYIIFTLIAGGIIVVGLSTEFVTLISTPLNTLSF